MIEKLNKEKTAKNAYRMIVEKSARSGESIEAIALSLEISERTIYYWQKGERTPNTDHLYRLSQFLRVPMESILV